MQYIKCVMKNGQWQMEKRKLDHRKEKEKLNHGKWLVKHGAGDRRAQTVHCTFEGGPLYVCVFKSLADR